MNQLNTLLGFLRWPLLFAFWACISCLDPHALHAQIKFEKESRIKRADVPQVAVRMIDALEIEEQVRWFREESEKGISYEAKYKHSRHWRSIEFDSTGLFQDAEIEIRERQIPEVIRVSIHDRLEKEFDRYQMRKVQRQLTGPREAVIRGLDSDVLPPGLTVKYEIIVKGRAKGETHLYEYLFSETGEQERKARILQRNTDHLVY